MPAILASLCLLFLLSAPSSAELPYQQVAKEFLSDHGITEPSPEELDLGAVLERDFFRAQVGLFEVMIPVGDLAKKETAKDFQGVCMALSEAQARWIEWLGDDAIEGDALVKDLESTQKWAKSWKVGELISAAEGDSRDAAELFAPKSAQLEAIERAATVMQARSVLGLSIEEPTAIRLVLMPHREQFVEFLAFAGWYRPELQPNFWVEGIRNWSEFRLDDLQVIALEYAAIGPAEGEYAQATSMKDRAQTGLEEQVVQLGMNKLLAYEHGAAMPGGLISGLSINMIIEQYGECHTSLDGDTRSRVTGKREQFVHGGRSEGGALPQNIALSRWRTDYGKRHYVRILKQVQKSGASADKRNRNQLNSFLLLSDNGAARTVAHAPLLGESATKDELPDDVLPDFKELVRAYKTAFLFWLQTEAAGSKKKSSVAFSSFMVKLSLDEEGDGFSKAVEEVYGMPLSDPELGSNCLETRFLKWISRQ